MKQTELQNAFDLPRYYIVGDRPVQFLATDNGGMKVEKFDWETGLFIEGSDYLGKTMFGKDDVERVDADEFIQHTERLRRRRFTGSNTVFALYDVATAIEQTALSENRVLTEEERRLISLTQNKTYPLFEKHCKINENYFKR